MTKNTLALLAGPLLAACVATIMTAYQWQTPALIAASVTCVCVVWWIFEPIPIPVTSLLPIAVFPLTGVLSQGQASQAYGDKLILLLLGGFILSTAMARSGTHLRLALTMVNLFGGNSSKRLVFGFMAASALLSMWISNTATTLMLLPVALAVLERSEDKNLAVPLLLGIAFGANIGGIGTPIGTPPNLIFMSNYAEVTGSEISFLQWMSWGVPVVLIFLPIVALWLTRNLSFEGQFHMPEVGAWRSIEKRVFWVFICTALLWVSRKEPFGGWSELLGLNNANDAHVALLAVVAMFLIPSAKGSNEKLLDWQAASTIPWGVLLLFGGGIAIAKAFANTGISASLGELLAQYSTLHLLLLMLLICLAVTFLTEMTSNTATSALLMPILAAGAIAASLDPAQIMVPAVMSASCAFMLPVATAPNTVVFSANRFSTQTMVREGVVLNIIGALVISTLCWLML